MILSSNDWFKSNADAKWWVLGLVNRPGVAGAVLQTPPLLTDYLSNPFPPNLQNTINPKPLK